jgi:DNA-binding FadR family transcriptional regulator
MLKAIADKTVTEQVQERLLEFIVGDRLEPGDPIPPECDLAAKLGVSRSTVREAIRSLEAIGILLRKRSRGTVVQEMDLSRIARSSAPYILRDASGMKELFMARHALEIGMLSWISANATEEDYALMEQANRRLAEGEDSPEANVEADTDFHQALLLATHSKFLQHFGRVIHDFFIESFHEHIQDAKDEGRGAREHSKLIKMLKAGDINGARQLMEQHLGSYMQAMSSMRNNIS